MKGEKANTVPAVVAAEGKKGQKSREKRDKNNESKPITSKTEDTMSLMQGTTATPAMTEEQAQAYFKDAEAAKARLAQLEAQAVMNNAAAAQQQAAVTMVQGVVDKSVDRVVDLITKLDNSYKKRDTNILYYKAGGMAVGAVGGFFLTAELIPDPTTAQTVSGVCLGALVGTATGNLVGQAMTTGEKKEEEKKK